MWRLNSIFADRFLLGIPLDKTEEEKKKCKLKELDARIKKILDRKLKKSQI